MMRQLTTTNTANDEQEKDSTTSNAQMWGEVIFSIAYLIVIWSLVLAMWYKRERRKQIHVQQQQQQAATATATLKKDQRLGDLFLLAFGLLAFGDSFHVGCRIAGNIKENLNGEIVENIGYGDLFGAITFSLFYAVMVVIWKERFKDEKEGYGIFGWFLFLMVPIRFALMVPPQNNWGSLTPSQPWSAIRNIPLIIQGLGVAFLILRDSCPGKDRALQWIGILIVVSYLCAIPVVFAGQEYEMLGMLMIPKTIAYVAMAFIAYYRYFTWTNPVQLGGDDEVHGGNLLEGALKAPATQPEEQTPC